MIIPSDPDDLDGLNYLMENQLIMLTKELVKVQSMLMLILVMYQTSLFH